MIAAMSHRKQTNLGTDALIFRFNPNTQGWRAILDKGFLVNTSAIGAILLALFLLTLAPFSLDNELEEVVIKLIFLFSFSVFLWHYYSTVNEVKLSKENLFFRRLKNWTEVPFGEVDHIRAYTLSTCGVTYIRIKKKRINKDRGSLFVVYAPREEVERVRLLSDLLCEMGKRTVLKHTQ